MKTIYLVTGAAGFMGTNVCAQLLSAVMPCALLC